MRTVWLLDYVSYGRYMLINVLTGTVGEALQLILQFVCRTIFIYTLAEEYLGINGLFENILKILSLTELGFGSALIYSMYKPISEDNRSEICALMNLYKRICCTRCSYTYISSSRNATIFF